MPLFICSNEDCFAIDNTAIPENEYWSRWTGAELLLCTECLSGKWHGLFPKKRATDAQLASIRVGRRLPNPLPITPAALLVDFGRELAQFRQQHASGPKVLVLAPGVLKFLETVGADGKPAPMLALAQYAGIPVIVKPHSCFDAHSNFFFSNEEPPAKEPSN